MLLSYPLMARQSKRFPAALVALYWSAVINGVLARDDHADVAGQEA
jgi:hypothetical protein